MTGKQDELGIKLFTAFNFSRLNNKKIAFLREKVKFDQVPIDQPEYSDGTRSY
jgi:hypothetical protein